MIKLLSSLITSVIRALDVKTAALQIRFRWLEPYYQCHAHRWPTYGFLLFVAVWFILRGDLFYILPCVILFLRFSPFSIEITSLWEERANLSAFGTFVRTQEQNNTRYDIKQIAS